MNKGLLTTAIALAAMGACATSASAATNLITNGSFETGSFSGWTLTTGAKDGQAPVVIKYNLPAGAASVYPTGAYGESIPADPNTDPATGASSGSYAAYFLSDNNSPNGDSISQTISGLTAGTTYTVSFDYYLPFNGYSNPENASLAIAVDGVTKTTFTASTQPAGKWLNFSSTFVADTSTANNTISFTFLTPGTGYGKDFLIDLVSVTAVVPEPASWAMMVGGFGLMGSAMRRKRTTLAINA